MSDLLILVVLGVIEGITEFLPISSTGHLIVAGRVLDVESVGGSVEIVIQLGAVIAVAWFYRRDVVERALAVRESDRARAFWGRLALAAVPAATIGFLLSDVITEVLFRPEVVALAMIVGGVVLWLVDRYLPDRAPEHATTSVDAMSWRQALAVGTIQVLALVPGTSRSASSIVGGLMVGLDRRTATAFSFWLALPTLGGATVYALLKDLGEIAGSGQALPLAAGIVAAFVTSLIAMGWLLRYVAHHDFRWFALYRVVAGVVVLLIVR